VFSTGLGSLLLLSYCLGELTTLRPIGSRHYGLCPFHKDTTASFSVDPKRGLYYCHGCQKGGDVFAFYRRTRGVGFNTAVEELAKRFGVVLPPSREVPPAAAGGVLQAATDFYAGRLLDSPAALNYLEQRGIPLEIARLYRLGYAGAGWQDLLRALEPWHAPEALLAKGLIARSEKGTLFDRLRNRIVFPVTDAAGRTAGFASRTPDPLHADYRFTPGTRRRYLLFGLHEALLKLGSRSERLLLCPRVGRAQRACRWRHVQPIDRGADGPAFAPRPVCHTLPGSRQART
jgi:DNA primase